MNIDLDELERKAKAASAKDALSFDEEDFSAYITPEIVCELINRLREAEKDAARYRHIISTGKFAPDLYGDSGIALSGRLNQCTKAEIDKYVDYAIAKGKGNG